MKYNKHVSLARKQQNLAVSWFNLFCFVLCGVRSWGTDPASSNIWRASSFGRYYLCLYITGSGRGNHRSAPFLCKPKCIQDKNQVSHSQQVSVGYNIIFLTMVISHSGKEIQSWLNPIWIESHFLTNSNPAVSVPSLLLGSFQASGSVSWEIEIVLSLVS